MAVAPASLWEPSLFDYALAHWSLVAPFVGSPDAPALRHWLGTMVQFLIPSRAGAMREHPLCAQIKKEFQAAVAELRVAEGSQPAFCYPGSAEWHRVTAPGYQRLELHTAPAVESWLAEGDARHTRLRTVIESLVLGDNVSASVTDDIRRSLEPLRTLLSRFKLAPVQQGQATGHGVAYCMLTKEGREAALLQCAIMDTIASTNAKGTLSLGEALSVVAALSHSDRTDVFAFPQEADAPAVRALLMRLGRLGFIFPMVLEHRQLFLVHPSLTATVWALPWRGTPTASTHDETTELHVERSAFFGESSPLPSKRHRSGTMGSRAKEVLADLGRLGDEGASSAVGWAVGDKDYVVTETNYRLYVFLRFTENIGADVQPQSSQTLLRLLDSFAERELVVPRFAVYRLTRARFLTAVRDGISKHQILAFLSSHAHPTVVAKDSTGQYAAPGVPQSIADQLSMWEKEARRIVVLSDAVMLVAPNAAAAERIVELAGRVGDGVISRSGLQIIVSAAAYDLTLRSQIPSPR